MAKKPKPHKLPNPLAEALRDLNTWFEAQAIRRSIIGGVAVALLGQPRVTQDIDAVIWLDTDRLEPFLQTGAAYGFLPRISDAAAFARANRVLLVQHQPTSVTVDLSCGALPFEDELIARARTLTVGSMQLKVATPEDLIIMKAIARRPRDIADIEALLNIEPNLDLARIRHWVGQFAAALEMPELLDNLESILRHSASFS